jgi:hypothetical protein
MREVAAERSRRHCTRTQGDGLYRFPELSVQSGSDPQVQGSTTRHEHPRVGFSVGARAWSRGRLGCSSRSPEANPRLRRGGPLPRRLRRSFLAARGDPSPKLRGRGCTPVTFAFLDFFEGTPHAQHLADSWDVTRPARYCRSRARGKVHLIAHRVFVDGLPPCARKSPCRSIPPPKMRMAPCRASLRLPLPMPSEKFRVLRHDRRVGTRCCTW